MSFDSLKNWTTNRYYDNPIQQAMPEILQMQQATGSLVPVMDLGMNWDGGGALASSLGLNQSNMPGMNPDKQWLNPFKWDQEQKNLMLGKDGSMGLLQGGLGAAKALGSMWMGMNQLDLAKDQFAFQKDAWNKQYENQRTLTNARLRDRQANRVAFNSNAESVDEYMKKNGI